MPSWRVLPCRALDDTTYEEGVELQREETGLLLNRVAALMRLRGREREAANDCRHVLQRCAWLGGVAGWRVRFGVGG